MATNEPKRTVSVGDFMSAALLADPTVPVPFEKFASLKESPDMLARAAFWCFYAAWVLDKQGKTAPAGLAVEARNDGHWLSTITQELSVRDAVIITRHDLSILERERDDNMYRASGALMWLWWAVAFVSGILVALWAAGVLW